MNKKSKVNVKRISVYGLITAVAIVLSWLESQIPPFFPVPGMKIGLTNIMVIIALYKMGSGSAMAVNVLRIVIVSFLFGGPSALLYSLSGGMLSTLVMIFLKWTGKFKTVTVSIAGGIFHNVGQILIAMLMMNTTGILWYLAVLWFTGAASGALIGILASLIVKRLPDKPFE